MLSALASGQASVLRLRLIIFRFVQMPGESRSAPAQHRSPIPEPQTRFRGRDSDGQALCSAGSIEPRPVNSSALEIAMESLPAPERKGPTRTQLYRRPSTHSLLLARLLLA